MVNDSVTGRGNMSAKYVMGDETVADRANDAAEDAEKAEEAVTEEKGSAEDVRNIRNSVFQ